MYFFETLVRVHRASEGAPYTGLKPAGEVEPPLEAAGAALESGSVDELARRVADHASAAIRERFNRAMEAKKHAGGSVEAGGNTSRHTSNTCIMSKAFTTPSNRAATRTERRPCATRRDAAPCATWRRRGHVAFCWGS